MVGKLATITAVLLIGLILLSGCTQPSNSTGQITLPAKQECKSETYVESVCEDVPYTERECHPETYSEQECITKEIPHKVEDWDVINTCLDYDEECKNYFMGFCTEEVRFCVKKAIRATGTLYNLDNEKDGMFSVKFSLYSSSSSTPVDQVTAGYRVYPQSNLSIGRSFAVEGRTDAEKTYRIGYSITPATKQVCQTVTKTKEVCNNVTKHRRECDDVQRTRQVCD